MVQLWKGQLYFDNEGLFWELSQYDKRQLQQNKRIHKIASHSKHMDAAARSIILLLQLSLS